MSRGGIKPAPCCWPLIARSFFCSKAVLYSDLLYFYGDQVPGFVRVKSDDPAHVLPGYDYDVVNEDALLHRMQYEGPDLHTPEGLHYRALTLPASQRISYAALVWISKFANQGGVVIGLKPTGPLGLIAPNEEAEYKRTADAIWAGCAGSATTARYGRGTVYCSAGARDALIAMGVAPDFSYQLNAADANAKGQQPFEFVHRRTAGAEIYFVRNTQPRELDAHFRSGCAAVCRNYGTSTTERQRLRWLTTKPRMAGPRSRSLSLQRDLSS